MHQIGFRLPYLVVLAMAMLAFAPIPAAAQSGPETVIHKTYCASGLGYDNIDDIRAELLLNAKREAAGERARGVVELGGGGTHALGDGGLSYEAPVHDPGDRRGRDLGARGHLGDRGPALASRHRSSPPGAGRLNRFRA